MSAKLKKTANVIKYILPHKQCLSLQQTRTTERHELLTDTGAVITTSIEDPLVLTTEEMFTVSAESITILEK